MGYTEIAPGMHWNGAEDPQGEPLWLPTLLDWESQPNGDAAIVQAPRLVWLSRSLLAEPMMWSKPNDQRAPSLGFSFHGLAYVDRDSGQMAWVAKPRESPLLVEGDLAWYPDIFEELGASWVVRHRLDGLSAGLLLHQVPAPPTAYGFTPQAKVDLVVVSEVFCEAPAETRIRSVEKNGFTQEDLFEALD